jgi:xanthine/uracil/vitamin C permease (AzgA family)
MSEQVEHGEPRQFEHEAQPSVRTEVIAGVTTFFTMAYIVVVNPSILAPLAGMVPPYATAAVLLMVGAAMFRSVTRIDFTRIEEALPAFLTIILIPLTFSITQGILWGFIAHTALYLLTGRRKGDSSCHVRAGGAIGRVACT